MISPKQEIKEMYKHYCAVYCPGSRSWSDIHEHFNPYMFCEANRLSIIGEYLTWLWFIKEAKRFGIVYYCGIDTFLAEYKDAVKSCVTLPDDAWEY